ncbi:hypothetical protein ABIB25_000498 [Nakamurella sp. UYEF19]|uniref:hypothetical protein n=1 Tax=Nakamurella sp. UYEF19 TaxID=1756392 RepID=UPI0033972F44
MYGGSGDNVVRIDTGDVPALLTISCAACTSNFIVEGNGGYEDSLLVNAVGSYTGRQLVDMTGDRTTQLTIQADAAWSVKVEPASTLRSSTRTSGSGDDAIYLGSGANFRLKHTGTSNFIVESYTPGSQFGDLIVNEIGNYNGVRPIDVPAYVEIVADGTWSITRA